MRRSQILYALIGVLLGTMLVRTLTGCNIYEDTMPETQIKNAEEIQNETTELPEGYQEIIEEEIDTSELDEMSFFMNIDDISFLQDDENTILYGRIKQGRINAGDTIQIIGLNHEMQIVEVESIGNNGGEQSAHSLDEVALKINGYYKNLIEKGQTAIEPDTNIASNTIKAIISLYDADRIGEKTIYSGYSGNIAFYTPDTSTIGRIQFPDDITEIKNAEDETEVTIFMDTTRVMQPGDTFHIVEMKDGSYMDNVIGYGHIVEIL